jgi:hypothetical protein
MASPAFLLLIARSFLAILAAATGHPSQTFCLLQDQAFVNSFIQRLGFGLLVNLGLYVGLPKLPWWWVTRPYLRAVASSLGLIFFAGGFPLGSWLALVLGLFLPSLFCPIDRQYLNCRGFDFGAQGIAGFGRGVALVFQPLLMGLIFLAALILWLLISFAATTLLSQSRHWPLALRHSLHGEES